MLRETLAFPFPFFLKAFPSSTFFTDIIFSFPSSATYAAAHPHMQANPICAVTPRMWTWKMKTNPRASPLFLSTLVGSRTVPSTFPVYHSRSTTFLPVFLLLESARGVIFDKQWGCYMFFFLLSL